MLDNNNIFIFIFFIIGFSCGVLCSLIFAGITLLFVEKTYFSDEENYKKKLNKIGF